MIRIIVVEDSKFLRELMLSELARQKDFEVLGSADSGEKFLDMVRDKTPDVVIMDVNLPGKTGIETTAELRKTHPACKVVVLTSSQAREDLFKALDAGASGFVSKDSPNTRLLEAVRSAHEGHALIDPAVTTHLIQEFVQFRKSQAADVPTVDAKGLERLTVREIEILYLIGQGKSNADIAQKLSVAEVTVKSHVHQVLRKLAMTSRMQLAIFANEIGLKQPGHSPPKD